MVYLFRGVVTLLTFTTAYCLHDLLLNFRHKDWTQTEIQLAFQHEQDFPSHRSETTEIFLACSSYSSAKVLEGYVTQNYLSYHPVHLSRKSDRICFTMTGKSSFTENYLPKEITLSTIPHILKLDDQLPQILNQLTSNNKSPLVPFVLEIGLGLGIQGKGIYSASSTSSTSIPSSDHSHLQIAQIILQKMKSFQSDTQLFNTHLHQFFYSNEKISKHFQKVRIESLNDDNKKHKKSQDPFSTSQVYTFGNLKNSLTDCNFDRLTVTALRSHVTFTTKKNYHDFPPSCYLILASIATVSESVSHVTGHYQPHTILPTDNIHDVSSTTFTSPSSSSSSRVLLVDQFSTSVDYALASNATDQNSWCQSYTSTQTPYSDIGLDGSGYVVGMIDTGIDDLSCFLIDWSGTETPRTAKADYNTPITELTRRKVVQYVAWADGEPQEGSDHGTWCGGAVVGKCINSTSTANAYNGLAYNSQITMFDVSVNNGDWLDVPSLYDISLPPAYKAGARVHSNSWGTQQMGSYNSKALDVDQFMVDYPDFLFVVAAGNDGRTGYTSVHSPGISKNALTVGASAVNHQYIAEFSGLGYDYDQHMIKPNIITPGQSVTSTGVRTGTQNQSCNVDVKSGTSMATPTGAASAVLIRQYFENATFWPLVCNRSYRSCPTVSKFSSGLISGELLKAAVIHSGEPMVGSSSGGKSLLPAMNFTTPPDLFQGWGQIKLTNLLPLLDYQEFDLYVADQESLTSMTMREYTVQVITTLTPLRITIAWSDPPNVMWATKNLLNDLDLRVYTPSGGILYGNNLEGGDEYNPVERVVINTPEVGTYTVQVIGNYFPLGATNVATETGGVTQTYGIVISSGGTVLESLTTSALPIYSSELTVSLEESQCLAQSNTSQLVHFQLEDYDAGVSWTNLTLHIYRGTTSVGNCTFVSNALTMNSLYNRIYQCPLCLPSGQYLVQLPLGEIPSAYHGNVRVAGSCDGVFLSQYQEQAVLELTNQRECNPCSGNSSRVGVLMRANATDDDFTGYTWYGEAFYRIVDHTSGYLVASGTLVVSDEESDRYSDLLPFPLFVTITIS
jgi:hypothetical protein